MNSDETIESALEWGESGESTGGLRTRAALRILAAEVRRLRTQPAAHSEDAMFYLMENREGRKWVGNDAVWWGPNNSGYTCRIENAGKYTEQQIPTDPRSKGLLIPVSVALVKSLAYSCCDHNEVTAAIRAAMNA